MIVAHGNLNDTSNMVVVFRLELICFVLISVIRIIAYSDQKPITLMGFRTDQPFTRENVDCDALQSEDNQIDSVYPLCTVSKSSSIARSIFAKKIVVELPSPRVICI